MIYQEQQIHQAETDAQGYRMALDKMKFAAMMCGPARWSFSRVIKDLS